MKRQEVKEWGAVERFIFIVCGNETMSQESEEYDTCLNNLCEVDDDYI